MSKKITLIALSVATATVLSSTCYAQHNNNDSYDKPWYVGISVSDTDLSTVNSASTQPVADVTRTLDVNTDDDTGFGFHIGRTVLKTNNGKLNLELSYSDSDHDIDTITFLGNDFIASDGTAEGSVDIETWLLRATYKFNLGAFNPYIGFGIGQSDFDIDARYGGSIGTTPGSQPPFALDDDSATAVEYRLGVEYDINERWGAFLQYSKTDVSSIEFSRTGGGPGGLATTEQSGDFDIDSISLGVNFRF